MDKDKAIIYGVVGIVLVFIIVYGFMTFGGSDKKQEEIASNTEFEAPQLSMTKKDYNDRIKKLRTKPKEETNIELKNPFETDQKEEEPEPVKEETKPVVKKSTPKPKPKPKPVVKEPEPVIVQEPKPKSKRRKSGYSKSSSTESVNNEMVQALVHGQQTVYDRAKIKLRLTDKIDVDGITIPRNTFVYGEVYFQDERVQVKIKNITYKNKIYNVDMGVFDRGDGIRGIYIPGGITQDATKESTGEIIDEISTSSNTGGGLDLLRKVGNVAKKYNNQTTAVITDNYRIFIRKN